MLQYTANEYIVLIRFSQNKHLLVEGSDDKRFFIRLISEIDKLYSQRRKLASNLDIDTAEKLVGSETGLGNREKVESISSMICDEDSSKFVGFVDREFRKFEVEETIQDSLPSHGVYSRLVWSRGHSVENYFFDSEILTELFKDHTPVYWCDKVTSMFDKVLESTLKLACALSLTGREVNRFDFIRSSIDWRVVELDSLEANLRLSEWSNVLSDKSNFSSTEIASLSAQYSFWREKLENTNMKTLRWLCHGHIGMTVIWAVYICCIYAAFPEDETKKPETVVNSVRGIGENIRFQALTGSLARRILQEQCEYPKEVIELLGLFAS